MERLYPDGPTLTIPKPEPPARRPKTMPQHRIQLRAAWTGLPAGGPGAEPVRIDLPTCLLAALGSEVRLERAFGAPPIDPGRETVRLVLHAVPGLKAVRLNGERLDAGRADPATIVVSLDGRLRRRNRLVLEVDARRAGDRPWGEVALLIDDRPAFTEP
jgi:hypothetical protein